MECNASEVNTNPVWRFMRKNSYCQIDLKNGVYTILLLEVTGTQQITGSEKTCIDMVSSVTFSSVSPIMLNRSTFLF